MSNLRNLGILNEQIQILHYVKLILLVEVHIQLNIELSNYVKSTRIIIAAVLLGIMRGIGWVQGIRYLSVNASSLLSSTLKYRLL